MKEFGTSELRDNQHSTPVGAEERRQRQMSAIRPGPDDIGKGAEIRDN